MGRGGAGEWGGGGFIDVSIMKGKKYQSELSPFNLHNSWIPSASLCVCLSANTSNSLFIVASLAQEEGYFYSLQNDVSFQWDGKTKVVGQWYNVAIWQASVYLF